VPAQRAWPIWKSITAPHPWNAGEEWGKKKKEEKKSGGKRKKKGWFARGLRQPSAAEEPWGVPDPNAWVTALCRGGRGRKQGNDGFSSKH
jgi:hypothetical protein